MEDYEVVEAAADYIEKHGWCRLYLADSVNRVCVDGALLSVTGSQLKPLSNHPAFYYPFESNKQLARVSARIVKALEITCAYATGEPKPHELLIWWNDSQMGSDGKQNILDGLRKAAKIIRVEDEDAERYEI